jgi:hypothetical protein
MKCTRVSAKRAEMSRDEPRTHTRTREKREPKYGTTNEFFLVEIRGELGEGPLGVREKITETLQPRLWRFLAFVEEVSRVV